MTTECQHKDRPNVLSLPSLGNPHCCRECWDARTRGMTPYKGKREAWDHQGHDYHGIAGATFYDSTRGRVQISPYSDDRIWK